MDDKYLKYQAVNSPSKIDQWCKPKPAAKLVLALVRRSPLMLKERETHYDHGMVPAHGNGGTKD